MTAGNPDEVDIPRDVGEVLSAPEVLVVDDNPSNLLAIKAALGELGKRMVRAESGPEALRRLLQRDFALVLLDVQMPGMDGFETARLIRGRKRSRHLPIIFITAHNRENEDIQAAYRLGAVDILFKPIVPEILQAKAGVFVSLQQRAAEITRQASLLRRHERREHLRSLEEQRRLWEEAALRRQMEAERRSSVELGRKAKELAKTVAEKERAQKDLERLNRTLADSDRRKDQFLAMLAHELRNPLSPIMNSLSLLHLSRKRAQSIPPESVESRAIDIIDRQMHQLTRLVDDLLDISRINAGKIELRKEKVSLARILEQAVSTSHPAIEEQAQSLEMELPKENLLVEADPVRLTQVVANLLNNAARYTPPGGHIRLFCTHLEGQVCIHVVDDGKGIPAEFLPRLFEMFAQERGGNEGLGLGLNLVKSLVELHGGSVGVVSGGSDCGSEFTVSLPWKESACEVDAEATLSAARDFEVVNDGNRDPLCICVVEDNPDIRSTLRELLEHLGHHVHCAENGPEGVRLIHSLQPSLAFVDIGLPELDGYGVARSVREGNRSKNVRLIAVTGFGQESDRARAFEAGFDGHLVKPLQLNSLSNLLSDSSLVRQPHRKAAS